jgi:hypothetical protein|tara:strand:+ start:314 stop:472 length:159 start_codon:yes stop_codon:yes gene_type:complete
MGGRVTGRPLSSGTERIFGGVVFSVETVDVGRRGHHLFHRSDPEQPDLIGPR